MLLERAGEHEGGAGNGRDDDDDAAKHARYEAGQELAR